MYHGTPAGQNNGQEIVNGDGIVVRGTLKLSGDEAFAQDDGDGSYSITL